MVGKSFPLLTSGRRQRCLMRRDSRGVAIRRPMSQPKPVPVAALAGTDGRLTSTLTARAPGASRHNNRVLVVEYDPDVARLIRRTLVKEGWEVIATTSSAETIVHARDGRPAIVLVDIGVPSLSGWEVCRRLRQDPDTRAIPIIMFTGHVEGDDTVLGFELGADDYITKAFSPRELVARIRSVARRRDGGEEEPKRCPSRSASSRSTGTASKRG